MWTGTTGKRYERNNGRYASDLTDEEWKVIERFIPKAGSLGRPWETDMGEVVNALLYIVETGYGVCRRETIRPVRRFGDISTGGAMKG